MLPHEVEPYANEHIEALNELEKQINSYILTPDRPNSETLEEWELTVMSAAGALHRFKVCMADELEEKERFAQTLRDHKIRPNMKAGS